MNLLHRPRWLSASAAFFILAALLAGFATVALAADASPAPGASGGPGAAALPGDPAKGLAAYNSAGCASCHGANLEGGIGPRLHPIENLGNAPDPSNAEYLIGVIANGLQGVGKYSAAMPAKGGKPSLTDQDVKDLAAYIISVQKATGGPALTAGELAKSNVTWVTLGILAMIGLTFLLAQYNMRWIARKTEARRTGGRV